MDLALNNLYRLICHKTKQNQTKPITRVGLLIVLANHYTTGGAYTKAEVIDNWNVFQSLVFPVRRISDRQHDEIKKKENWLSHSWNIFVWIYYYLSSDVWIHTACMFQNAFRLLKHIT